MSIQKIIATVVAGIIGLVFGSMMFEIIPEGNVGVVTRFGKAISQENAGLMFKMPIDSVEEIEVREKKTSYELAVATKEQMPSNATVSVNWLVTPTSVKDIYVKYGSLQAYSDRIMAPKVKTIVKSIISQYTAEENINNREIVRSSIESKLKDTLQTGDITITAFAYENIRLPKTYVDTIAAKQAARNARDAEKFKLEKQALQAQQLVNTANAERDAQKAKADGEAYRISTVAKAEAEAIELKRKALGTADNYLRNEQLKKWDGTMPTTVVESGKSGLFNMIK